MKQREIKNLVKSGKAEDITFGDVSQLMKKRI